MRSTCTFLALVFLMHAAVGCEKQTEVIEFGTTRADLFGVPAEYRALHMALEKELDYPISFPAQSNGRAIGVQLEHGNIEFAILSAAEYAEIEDTSKLTLVATAINPLGKTTRQGQIVIRAKSHLKSISDCAGKRFAFGHYRDAVTDWAVRDALEKGGVPVNKLLPELVPTTVAVPIEGRLYAGDRVPTLVVWDLTINAGVVDEIVYSRLPDTGGNPITGPSKDQLEIVGHTIDVPEMVIVAGPKADPQTVEKLRKYLLNKAKNDAKLCEQLGIQGFTEPNKAAYEAARSLVSRS